MISSPIYCILTYYSKSKGILHHLKKGNSITVTYDVFLKAYFSMAIDAPELQSEVKGFLKKSSSSYSTTLEIIHLDYRTQTTGEETRSKPGAPSGTLTLHHGKTEVESPKKDNYFPPNVRKLLPSSCYTQVCS